MQHTSAAYTNTTLLRAVALTNAHTGILLRRHMHTTANTTNTALHRHPPVKTPVNGHRHSLHPFARPWTISAHELASEINAVTDSYRGWRQTAGSRGAMDQVRKLRCGSVPP